VLDLLLIFLALPLLVPVILCTMLAIRIDSSGKVFYRQTRIGKCGQTFKVLKFRTMVENADIVLKKYLEENPEMQAEWAADQKLRNDPRITRVGRILRKTSLDELPQLWNVIKGEMSLVGPRPIVAAEIERYGDKFKYYEQVPPGISGLWQVSGRNDVDYEQRVNLDAYYVRNRSIWMNLHIIIRTFLVVLRRDGAY
jgi:Undecaprenyl-phosphate galactose phosphotransferase WbaP